jgi:hypothetical protein
MATGTVSALCRFEQGDERMASVNTKTINSWEWDVRVRERNMRKGVFDEKDVEKFISQLPDVSDQAESIGLVQPALGRRED